MLVEKFTIHNLSVPHKCGIQKPKEYNAYVLTRPTNCRQGEWSFVILCVSHGESISLKMCLTNVGIRRSSLQIVTMDLINL